MSRQMQVQREYSKKKTSTVEKVAQFANKYPVIVVASLSKVRSAQLMAVRKVLRGQAEIIVVKNKLAILALKKAGIKNADDLLKHLTGQNAVDILQSGPVQGFSAAREEQGQPGRARGRYGAERHHRARG